jgi:2-dehydro-3-deoxyphosphooctonate aldolase (KDO 8-P synthase)
MINFMRSLEISGFKIGDKMPLVFIGGPCVIESEEDTIYHATKIKEITARVGLPFIFKSSYDKANRLSLKSFRGPGLKEGLRILEEVKKRLKVPLLTDVHKVDELELCTLVVDIIQIPAFLCRQTDLVVEASKTGKVINIKKGQFMSPWDMRYIVEKALSTGNDQIILTERGTTFGYGHLVNDMRSIAIMKSFGFPVIFDAGHSVQMPGGMQGQSGGMPEMIPVLARSAVACGADGLYIEVHKDPVSSPSDAQNMLRLEDLEGLLITARKIRDILVKA